jgi:hypothetical protein
MLSLDLDRENFPPIPVDTVLMEAARVMDEWPEVQRRLPDNTLPLQKTAAAMALKLDLDQELSSVFEGRGNAHAERSGLTHEQETVLTYVSEPQSIQGILQITRYDELDTCKVIADLLKMGLLEVSRESVIPSTPAWNQPMEVRREPVEPAGPSPWFWPLVALFVLAPIFTYVDQSRSSLNLGLASLQPADFRIVTDPVTRDRQSFALRMVSPADGGASIAKELGISLLGDQNGVLDFTKLPDPLFKSAPAPQPLPADPR